MLQVASVCACKSETSSLSMSSTDHTGKWCQWEGPMPPGQVTAARPLSGGCESSLSTWTRVITYDLDPPDDPDDDYRVRRSSPQGR